jgi:hypothetical protein
VATAVLRRYRDAMQQAAAVRQAADDAITSPAARAAVLGQARVRAVAELAGPGRVPMSADAVTLGGLRVIVRGEMDEVELLMARVLARQVCAITRQTEQIVADARRRRVAGY